MEYLVFNVIYVVVLLLALFLIGLIFFVYLKKSQIPKKKEKKNLNILTLQSGASGPVASGTLRINGKDVPVVELLKYHKSSSIKK